jgi:hypothetical protein
MKEAPSLPLGTRTGQRHSELWVQPELGLCQGHREVRAKEGSSCSPAALGAALSWANLPLFRPAGVTRLPGPGICHLVLGWLWSILQVGLHNGRKPGASSRVTYRTETWLTFRWPDSGTTHPSPNRGYSAQWESSTVARPAGGTGTGPLPLGVGNASENRSGRQEVGAPGCLEEICCILLQYLGRLSAPQQTAPPPPFSLSSLHTSLSHKHIRQPPAPTLFHGSRSLSLHHTLVFGSVKSPSPSCDCH